VQTSKWQQVIIHLIAGLSGVLVIYTGGVAWLAFFLGDFQSAFQQGLLPFIGVDVGKAIVAALVASGGRLLFMPPTVE
jgi:biotin transporter BioY